MDIRLNDTTILENMLKKYAAASLIEIKPASPDPSKEAIQKANNVIRLAKYLGQKEDWSFLQLFENKAAAASTLNEFEIQVMFIQDGNPLGPESASFYKLYNIIFWHLEALVRIHDIYFFEDRFNQKDRFGELISEISQNKEKSAKLVKESERILADSKTVAAKLAVEHYEQVFGDESKEFSKSAWLWLTALLAALSALVSVGLWYLPTIPTAAAGGQIAEIIFKKIVIITGLFYLIALFARNYRASKHNEILNKHRQNALKTFLIFTTSVQSNDLQTKNAILLKATEVIFNNQPTGFMPDTGDGDMSPKIIEIFKNFPSK